jgi:hypothetical protein
MDDALFIGQTASISKKGVRKWAQDWAKRFKELRRELEKAGDDDFDAVLKGLDVDNSQTWRLFRNRARKVRRESATPKRYQRDVLKLIDRELKDYTKIADALAITE